MAKAAGGAEDFSTTNIQVQGVDEGDIVKNDNEYAYVMSEKNVTIIDVFFSDIDGMISMFGMDSRIIKIMEIKLIRNSWPFFFTLTIPGIGVYYYQPGLRRYRFT